MGYLSERAAYLKGLAEGLSLDEKTSEGKVLLKMLDLLEEITASIEDNDEAIIASEERIDHLEDFVDDFVDAMDECGCEHDDCNCDCDDDCDCDDEEFYEVECPHCNEKVYFDEDMLDNDLICPNCDGKIEIEFDE